MLTMLDRLEDRRLRMSFPGALPLSPCCYVLYLFCGVCANKPLSMPRATSKLTCITSIYIQDTPKRTGICGGLHPISVHSFSAVFVALFYELRHALHSSVI